MHVKAHKEKEKEEECVLVMDEMKTERS